MPDETIESPGPHGPGRVVVPLRGVPDGLVAVTVPRRVDGEARIPRDRRGRLRPRRVDLTTANGASPQPVLPANDMNWLLAAERRAWPTVTGRFGSAAWGMACQLARAGVVHIRCDVDGADLAEPTALLLTDLGLAQRATRAAARTASGKEWKDRADVAAIVVQDLDLGLATALRSARGTESTLPVLVHAAEDLAAGRVHDGPRAFSQTHFRYTKQRDDAPAILHAAGASPKSLAALGLERSPYLGLGGAIRLDDTELSRLRGPVLFRANDPALNNARPLAGTGVLVIVENLQAAESICDSRTDLAVAYSAGQPSDAALRVIAGLAAGTSRVLVVPDADLGGVRITERVLDALPAGPNVSVVDVGEQLHERRDAFAAATLSALETCTSGSAASLAKAVLARGYPVEQEAATRAAVARALSDKTSA